MNKNSKLIIYLLIVVLVGGGFLFWKSYHRLNNNNQNNLSPSAFPSNTETPVPSKTPNPQPANPATCNISGSINFLYPTTAEDNAKLTYTGINSPASRIYWTITPNENDLKIGPNLAASLKLPDGESQVIVVLPPNPISKTYSLKAAMTYEKETNGLSKAYSANCSGTIKVNLNY